MATILVNLPPRELAIRASDELHRIAGGLCADPAYIQFCSALQTTLINTVEWLRDLPEGDEFAEKTEDLLEDLESLCQVSACGRRQPRGGVETEAGSLADERA